MMVEVGGSGDLQRALEAQVVEELRRQNEDLRLQVAALQTASTKMKAAKKTAEPALEKSPKMFTPMEVTGDARRTPGGTQVPRGTPPDVDMNNGSRAAAELPPVLLWPIEPSMPGKRTHDESFWKIFESGQTVWKNYDVNKPYQGETVGAGGGSGPV